MGRRLHWSRTGNTPEWIRQSSAQTSCLYFVYILSLCLELAEFLIISDKNTPLSYNCSGNKGEHLSALHQRYFGIQQLIGDDLIKYHRWKHSTHHLRMYFQERRILYVRKYFFPGCSIYFLFQKVFCWASYTSTWTFWKRHTLNHFKIRYNSKILYGKDYFRLAIGNI